MLNSTEHEISTAHKTKMLKNEDFLLTYKHSGVFIMLINVKMPTIVAMYEHNIFFIMLINVKMPKVAVILTFISTINFTLN